MTFHKQTGVALITILLVLSLATVAAVGMTTRQQLDIRRTSNMLKIEEAYMVLLAMEDVAKRGLIWDAKDNQTDDKNDFWVDLSGVAQLLPPLGNFIVNNLSIEDLQGRFNLANLVNGGNVDQNNQRNFLRLLQQVGLPERLADVAVDWMDEDTLPTGQGAEQDAYLTLEKPYRTPNTEMASASELFRLDGVNLQGIQDVAGSNKDYRKRICNLLTGDDLQCQIPSNQDPALATQLSNEKGLFVVLPERTPINVNTVKSPLIFMMMTGLDKDDADNLMGEINIGQNADAHFDSNQEFWERGIVNNRVPANERVDISFSSNYFLFRAEISDKNNPDFVVYLNTILNRTGTQGAQASYSVQVVKRSFAKSGEI